MERPVEVEFSEWTPWVRRNSIPNRRSPGIYLIAIFDASNPPNAPAVHTEGRIIYIGMTGTRSFKTLRNRWRAFHRSVFEGKCEHAGCISYRNRKSPPTSEGLYVAAFPHVRPLIQLKEGEQMVEVSVKYLEELKRIVREDPALSDPLNCAWRLYVERRCLFEYALANTGQQWRVARVQ